MRQAQGYMLPPEHPKNVKQRRPAKYDNRSHERDTVDCRECGIMAGTSGTVWEMAGSVCRVSSVDTAWDI